MRLYDHLDCPYGMKVRIVLAEKEMDFELIEVDLKVGQQRQPEFLRLNPFGKVPVLVDEDCVIYDSTIINEYLDDEYPEPALRPVDSDARARVRLLEDYADTAFTLPAMAIQVEQTKGMLERDEGRLETARGVVTRGIEMLNRELEGREYLAGEFSLADVAFAPMALQFERLGTRLDPALKNVRGWLARLGARQSIAAVPKLVA
jgi:glutathione S-transferase